MARTVKLVLWDIDGTLVDSARLGLEAFVDAFGAVCGRSPSDFPPFAGRTDLEIAHDFLALHDVEPDGDLMGRFESALAAAMAARSEELGRRGRALPGAAPLLARLAARREVIQSLLTGNIAPNARVKLAPFGLDRFVDFDVGAYGSDHRVRGELVAIARTRAERKHSLRLAPDAVVLVGDTPLDIAAARHGGARAVGVATGPYGPAELEAAGADAVLADLSDEELALRAVMDGT